MAEGNAIIGTSYGLGSSEDGTTEGQTKDSSNKNLTPDEIMVDQGQEPNKVQLGVLWENGCENTDKSTTIST